MKKTKDFGTVTREGESYKWTCPYIDISFREGKSTPSALHKRN